uniref:Uncharacterized protein n=1 Tax=Arundo donax TaxID=35708 RepID=A0A0A9GJX4_ARUDO
METLFAGFNCTIYNTFKIDIPKGCQILLHNNIIIKKQYLVKLGVYFWHVEP